MYEAIAEKGFRASSADKDTLLKATYHRLEAEILLLKETKQVEGREVTRFVAPKNLVHSEAFDYQKSGRGLPTASPAVHTSKRRGLKMRSISLLLLIAFYLQSLATSAAAQSTTDPPTPESLQTEPLQDFKQLRNEFEQLQKQLEIPFRAFLEIQPLAVLETDDELLRQRELQHPRWQNCSSPKISTGKDRRIISLL